MENLTSDKYPLATYIKEIHLKRKHYATVLRSIDNWPNPLLAYAPNDLKLAMEIATIAIKNDVKVIFTDEPDIFCLECNKGICAK